MTRVFDSMNSFRTFKFSASSSPLDWNKISTLDIDKIIATRDIQTLIANLDIVITCNIGAEIQRNGFSDIFIKLFRLSQIGIEFLLYCKVFLQNSLCQMEEELQLLKQGSLTEKEKKINQKKKRRPQVVLTAAVKSASFKCSTCTKIFVSNMHLNHHISKKHKENDIQAPKQKPRCFLGDFIEGQQICHAHSSPKESYIESIPTILERRMLYSESNDSEILKPINKSQHVGSSNATRRLEELLVNMENDLISKEHSKMSTLPDYSFEINKVLPESQNILHASEFDTSNINKQQAELQTGEMNNIDVLNKLPLNIDKSNKIRVDDHTDIFSKIEEKLKLFDPQQSLVNNLPAENYDDYNEGTKKCILPNAMQFEDEYSSDEECSSTEYETSCTSEEMDMNRLREEIEHIFESKLRSLGIDPEWHKIPDSVAKANAASLNALRKSYAKKNKNYFTIRNHLKKEIDSQLHLKAQESKNQVVFNSPTYTIKKYEFRYTGICIWGNVIYVL